MAGGFALVMVIITAFVFACGLTAVMVARLTTPKGLGAVDPEKVLATRFAKGEIDEAEYARRLSILRLGPPLELPD